MHKKKCPKCKRLKKVDEFCKDKRRKYGRGSPCKLCCNEAKKIKYIECPEISAVRAKRYYGTHTNKTKESAKEWVKDNPEKRKIICRNYRLTHPKEGRVHVAKRRALVKGANICAVADMKLMRLIYLNCPSGYHVDHIIPLSKGGDHHPNNLQYLPALINIQKHNHLDFDCFAHVIRWQSLIETESMQQDFI